MHDNLLSVGVDVGNELVGGWDESSVLQFEQNVLGGIVNGGNLANDLTVRGFYYIEAHERRQGQLTFGFFCQGAWEIDIAPRQLRSTLLGVHIAKLNQSQRVVAEAILFHKERYENAVDFQNEVIGISGVEDIVVKLERHLAFHTMSLA